MTSFQRRSLPPPPPDAADPTDAEPPSVKPDEGIPQHVWQTLQEAGERAAEKLLAILESSTFDNYPASAKRGLIELAFTRAYGLPVKRSVNVSLNSDDADAVAASIMALRDQLPERQGTPRDVTPPDDS